MDGLQALKMKLTNREKIFASTLLELAVPQVPRAMKGFFDFVFVDLEHGDLNPEQARPFFQVCRGADLPVIARVQDCTYHCISKCIDMGADGVMIPRTETLAQVDLAVQSTRFYPRGRKGYGGSGLYRPGEKFADINANRLLLLQVESPTGVQNLDDILSRYGEEVAAIIIGPNDLTILSGCNLDVRHQTVIDQIRQVISVCARHSKSVGIYAGSYDDVAFWHQNKANIFWHGSEFSLLSSGASAVFAKLDEVTP